MAINGFLEQPISQNLDQKKADATSTCFKLNKSFENFKLVLLRVTSTKLLLKALCTTFSIHNTLFTSIEWV